jgi:hypothetical protein
MNRNGYDALELPKVPRLKQKCDDFALYLSKKKIR